MISCLHILILSTMERKKFILHHHFYHHRPRSVEVVRRRLSQSEYQSRQLPLHKPQKLCTHFIQKFLVLNICKSDFVSNDNHIFC